MTRNEYCKSTNFTDAKGNLVFEEDILELDDTNRRIQKSRYGVVECLCEAESDWMVLCANGNKVPLKEIVATCKIVGTFLNDADRYLTALVKRRVIGW